MKTIQRNTEGDFDEDVDSRSRIDLDEADAVTEKRFSSYSRGQDPGLGMYLDDVNKYFKVRGSDARVLTAEEEVEFVKRIRAGDEAANEEFILRNVRLVVKIAKEYVNRGLSLSDLINEGNIGLMKAAQRFKPEVYNTKFSTYASWWIKQGIKRAIAEAGHIRLPCHMHDKMNRIRRTASALEQMLQREPTDAELAAELDEDPEWVKRYRKFAQPISLHLAVDEDLNKGVTIGDCIVDESELLPSDRVNRDGEAQLLYRTMREKLTARERDILYLRFGLYDGCPLTLEQIGKRFKLTRERIRQIQAQAERKLRNHEYLRRKREEAV